LMMTHMEALRTCLAAALLTKSEFARFFDTTTTTIVTSHC
jgi:hypothetical protein